MQHLEGSGTPVLYIGRTVLKGKTAYGSQLPLACINSAFSICPVKESEYNSHIWNRHYF